MTIPFSVVPVDQGGRFGATLLSPGAGRAIDYTWPDPTTVKDTTATNAQMNIVRNKLNNSTLVASVGSFGGGGANIGAVVLPTLGGPYLHIGGSTVGDGQGQIVRFSGGPFLTWRIKKAPATKILPQYNDFGVWRIYANIAYDAYAGGGAVDSGLQFTQDGGLLIAQAKAGVGFFRTAAGVIKLSIVPVAAGGAITTQLTSASSFDDTKENSYEFVIVAATAFAPAQFYALINGVVLYNIAINPGVNFPDNPGVNFGYVAQMVFIQGGGAAIGMNCNAINGVRIIAAPTLAAIY